jgi:hypothetical protein
MSKFSISERFACTVLVQHHSTHRKNPGGRADEEPLTADMYLADVLDRIHDLKINRLDESLSWNWSTVISISAEAA